MKGYTNCKLVERWSLQR